MSELSNRLREQFHDPDFRHIYADECLNSNIATQIKVLREQRGLTQSALAKAAGMAQPRIAVLEDINYSAWSINTLRRLANAFDLRLSVKFETFSSLIPEIQGLTRESLQRASFGEDTWFHQKKPAAPVLGAGFANSPSRSSTFEEQILGQIAQPNSGGLGGAFSSIAG